MQSQLLLNGISASDQPTYSDLVVVNNHVTYDETEFILSGHLELELARFKMLAIAPIVENDVTAKFKYSSALQKSIRRGFVTDAVKFALSYHALDPQGFWTRLVVVAFEDIGLGDPWAVALTLVAARSKVFRQKIGGDEKVIGYIVSMLARSIKDRSCADFIQVLWHRPRKFKDMTALRTATTQELTAFALSERNPTAFRSCAGWLLAGTNKYECKTLPLRSGSREQFCAMVSQMEIPALVKYLILRGMVACRYPMQVVYPFLWQMKEKSLYVSVETSRFPAERYFVGGLPTESFDIYTRQGRSSFGYFTKSCPQVDYFLTNKGITSMDAKIKAIGAVVFVAEGSLLDRKLVFEGLQEITEAVEQIDYL